MMEMLTPDEFFERVGVRVPDSVIRNLERIEKRWPECVWWLGPYLPITGEIIGDAVYPRRDGIVGRRAKLESVDGDEVRVVAEGRITFERAMAQIDLLLDG